MLAFAIKQTLAKPLATPLAKMAEECADKYADTPAFIDLIDGWRERVRTSTAHTSAEAQQCKQTMLEYAKLARVAAHRFRGASMSKYLKFEWRDAFAPDSAVAHPDFNFDRMACLFSVAACLAFLATHEDRGTAEGVKAACLYFQQAAGTLLFLGGELRESGLVQLTTDLSNEAIDMLQSLMLAQAQKCFYEKAERDGLKDSILAKLAAEVAALYQETHLKLGPIKHLISDGFSAIVDSNRLMFDSRQHYHAAQAHLEALEYGKQVARLEFAVQRMGEAVNIATQYNFGELIKRVFQEQHSRTVQKRDGAKKDNDLIYTEKVPPVATLPPLERKLMVKAITPPELLESVEMPEPMAKQAAVMGSNLPAGPTHTFEAKLYKPAAAAKLGVTLTSYGGEAPIVTALSDDGIAQQALKLGDVLVSVNSVACAGHEAATSTLRALSGEIKLLVQRAGLPPDGAAKPATAAPSSETREAEAAPATPPPAFSEAVSMPPPPPSFEDALAASVSQLETMGFGKEAATEALKKTQGNVEAAADLLLQDGVP